MGVRMRVCWRWLDAKAPRAYAALRSKAPVTRSAGESSQLFEGDNVATRLRRHSGQMTVELAVAMPVLIVVALIAVNACTFFVDCALFDRVAHDAVRVHAASPGYRQTTAQSCSLIEQEIRAVLDDPNLNVSVTCEHALFDFERFVATLEYSPTLFGIGMRSSVFGVEMPRASHTTALTVDVYKPGVII